MRALTWVLLCSMLSGGASAQSSPATPRAIAARSIPTPTTVSPPLQSLIAQQPVMPQAPGNVEEWHQVVQRAAERDLQRVAAVRKQFAVSVEPVQLGGVPCFIITPAQLPESNQHRLLLHLHGGAYVFAPGEAGTLEAIVMAGFGHMKVISVDYRMPPDHPYPAAMDDAMAVWKALVQREKPDHIGIFGTSTGGGMTLALVQRIKEEGQPLPGAIAPGTPWSDLTKTGDSYYTNETVDNALVAYEPLLGAAARLYAHGRDLKDPHLSPVYGDFQGFPPTLLTTGTRDLFLSNTIRVHRKLREAGVEAQLEVYEGQSHAQYLADSTTP
ncbi:MAG: esterase, partial [Gammaproteobacteria bacterium]|nr:esterase [Gammaproteobacteria bacterium]